MAMQVHSQQEPLGWRLHHLVAEKELDKAVCGTPAPGGSQEDRWALHGQLSHGAVLDAAVGAT